MKLSSGAIAVVTHVHAPDPHRPRVRVIFDENGTRLDLPYDRNLWDAGPGEKPDSILSPVEPAQYGVDPLNYLQTESN